MITQLERKRFTERERKCTKKGNFDKCKIATKQNNGIKSIGTNDNFTILADVVVEMRIETIALYGTYINKILFDEGKAEMSSYGIVSDPI